MDVGETLTFRHRSCQNGEHNKYLCVPPNLDTIPHPGGVGVALFEKMKENKNKVAQIDAVTGNKETYSDILLKCIRIAENLKIEGLKKNDVVTFCTFNNLDCFPTYIASLFTGACFSALDPVLSLEDSIHLLKILEPKIIYCDQAGLKLIEQCLEKTEMKTKIIFFGKTDHYISFEKMLIERENEKSFAPIKANNVYDTALIYFTSGTTGTSKCIAISHYAILYVAMQYTEPVVHFFVSRICWISAAIIVFQSVLAGSSWIMCPEYKPNDFLNIMRNYKVNIFTASPYFTYKLIEAATQEIFDLKELKLILTIGGKLTLNQILTLKKIFPNTQTYNGYGFTEMVTAFTLFSSRDLEFLKSKPTCCGRPVKGLCVKVVDPQTNEILGPNKPGEVRFKSNFLMNGYYKDPETTAKAFDDDGYFCSGDLMYYDEDYCFFYIDRIKDMIKFRSFYVTPSELESVLIEHPDVVEAVVVSVPSAKDGDHPTGIVVLKQGAVGSAEEIRKFVDDQVLDYKRLRGGVKIVKEIPKTSTFKLRRRDLRKMILCENDAETN